MIKAGCMEGSNNHLGEGEGGDRVQSGPTGIVRKKCKKLGQGRAVLTRMGCRGLGIVLRGMTCNVRMQKTSLACDMFQQKNM
jgi:hypothetical protein